MSTRASSRLPRTRISAAASFGRRTGSLASSESKANGSCIRSSPRSWTGCIASAIKCIGDTRTFGEIEAEAASQRRGFGQAHGQYLAEAVGFSRPVADKRVALLVVAEEFGAERAHRQQSVSARLGQSQEESKTRHAG